MKKRIFTPQEKKNQNSHKYIGRKKKYRRNHTKVRNKCRSRNYKKTRPMIRKNRPWSAWDLGLIKISLLNEPHVNNDRLLALALGRSVQAVQQKRYQLKKENQNG